MLGIDDLPNLPTLAVDSIRDAGQKGVGHLFVIGGAKGDGPVDAVIYDLAFEALGRADYGLALGLLETEDGVLEIGHGGKVEESLAKSSFI